MSFENLQLNEKLLQAIAQEGYHTATPIQTQAIPPILSGRDLWGCAQTGTGKTAAFALPALQRLLETKDAAIAAAKAAAAAADQRAVSEPHSHGGREGGREFGRSGARRRGPERAIRALVLAPTRELAAQIGASFQVYGRFCGLRQTVIYGGVAQGRQVQALRDGVDILVATPGRLLDLMQQGHIRLSAVELLILDEADQMLDMGFLPDLKRIVSYVPSERQTLMFSATMPPEIRELAEQWLSDPVRVQVAAAGTTTARVEQVVYMVESRDKAHFLAQFLQEQTAGRTLVFTRTKHGADKVVRVLERAGLRAAAIHGNKSQNARMRVLAAFKSQRPPVLVATDIAARGLDIDQIAHVVNYDLPNVPETYVHRIGRTGRAGADGIAISLCSGEERGLLRQIERLTRVRLAVRKYELQPREAGAEDEREPVESQRERGERRRGRDDRPLGETEELASAEPGRGSEGRGSEGRERRERGPDERRERGVRAGGGRDRGFRRGRGAGRGEGRGEARGEGRGPGRFGRGAGFGGERRVGGGAAEGRSVDSTAGIGGDGFADDRGAWNGDREPVRDRTVAGPPSAGSRPGTRPDARPDTRSSHRSGAARPGKFRGGRPQGQGPGPGPGRKSSKWNRPRPSR